MPMVTFKNFYLNEIVMNIGHVKKSMLGMKLNDLIVLWNVE